jgi:hypothetical protein
MNWKEQFDKKADDFNSGMTLEGKYVKERWKDFISTEIIEKLIEELSFTSVRFHCLCGKKGKICRGVFVDATDIKQQLRDKWL